MVKRLYKYNFNKKYVEIELEILNYLSETIKSLCIHNLKTIKNDIYCSKKLSLEFNNIYSFNVNLTIMTPGIWGISPKLHKYSNNMFNKELTTLTNEVDIFYKYKKKSKNLVWCYDICSCIINYNINNELVEIECPLNYANIL